MPAPDADRPSWVKVGVIAAVGFVVGVGWPKLAGIRLGPSAPAEATAATSAAGQAEIPSAAPLVTASAPPIAPAAVTRPVVAPVVAPAVAPPSVVVGHGAVLTCKTEDGQALKGAAACGGLAGFDAVARPRLAKLATCPAASGATGKLSALFSIDFKTNHVGVDVGKSSTLSSSSSSDGMAGCLKSSFQGVSLGPIQHDNVKYAVAYSITFSSPTGGAAPPPDAPPPSGGPSPESPRAAVPPSAAASIAAPSAAEEGSAQVVWEVALVRDSPRTGQVVARLARGTRVRLMNGEEGWYKVQFGPSFSTEGYVYRGAIGK
jgi:hypothetical protein